MLVSFIPATCAQVIAGPPPFSRSVTAIGLAVGMAAALFAVQTGAQQMSAGPNVNMVKGTENDPYLQRQAEPSLDVSTRNPCHILAGAVDYRTVDVPDPTPIDPPNPLQAAAPHDSWLGVYKSFDCGATWTSELIDGYPQSNHFQSPLYGYVAAADPIVRAGTNGMFFYGGMAFNREGKKRSAIFINRFIDNNDRERGDTFSDLGSTVIDVSEGEDFLDKPWLAVDIPRNGYGAKAEPWTTTDDVKHFKGDRDDYTPKLVEMCHVNGQRFPAGRIFMAWAKFKKTSPTDPTPAKMMAARSDDCGASWKIKMVSQHVRTSQGAAIAISPSDGTAYLAWREFAKAGERPSIYMVRSTDGGDSWSKPFEITDIYPFDQPRSANPVRFRTNTLPTITADNRGHVYVAWAARGYAVASGRADRIVGDSRIVLAVSSDGGKTFAKPYAIDDPKLPAGHQVMPSLSYRAGKLLIAFYDFREDPVPSGQYIDGGNSINHRAQVWAAEAAPGGHPTFRSFKVSRFRQTVQNVNGKPVPMDIEANLSNLPLYGQGTVGFLGDYIDTAGLSSYPIQRNGVQEWVPNVGPAPASSTRAALSATVSATNPSLGGFPPLPIAFTAATDNRDVVPPLDNNWTLYYPPNSPLASCDPSGPRTGMRNANIYTSRLTPGVVVGSLGNTKPLGMVTRGTPPIAQHIQRGFVIFLQNTTKENTFFRLNVANQPGTALGDRATFFQLPAPPYSSQRRPPAPTLKETQIDVQVTPLSTFSRTVYVTANNRFAQVRIDVRELSASAGNPNDVNYPLDVLALKPDGLKTSVLLNPDRTNPPIRNPDVPSQAPPSILEEEVSDPIIFAPILTSIPDPIPGQEISNPVGTTTKREENPREGNPREGTPREGTPREGTPRESNAGLENTAIADVSQYSVFDYQFKTSNASNKVARYTFSPVVAKDKFAAGTQFQVLVTKRAYLPAINDLDCSLVLKYQNQVQVNMASFMPREGTPREGTPREGTPREGTAGEQTPREGTPREGTPREGTPREGTASFLAAPGDTYTATLRVFVPAGTATARAVGASSGPDSFRLSAPVDMVGYLLDPHLDTSGAARSAPAVADFEDDGDDDELLALASPTDAAALARNAKPLIERTPRPLYAGAVGGVLQDIDVEPPIPSDVGAKLIAASIDTAAAAAGERLPESASATADLITSDPPPTASASSIAPGGTFTFNWTLTNRAGGTANPPPSVPFNNRFLLSMSDTLAASDLVAPIPSCAAHPPQPGRACQLAMTIFSSPVAANTHLAQPPQALTIPRITPPGNYSVIVVADADNSIFEDSDANNGSEGAAAWPLTVAFTVAFAVQPTNATESLAISPAVKVALFDAAGLPVPAADVPQLAIAIGFNPAGGTLSGTTVRPNVNGVVTFDDLRINNPGNGYRLLSAGVLTAPFNIVTQLPPVASSQSITTAEDTPVNGTLTATDPENNPITYSVDTNGTKGTAVVTNASTGAFTYTPRPDENGGDSFTFLANDGIVNSAAATVTVNITAVNDPPIEATDSKSTAEDTPLVFPASDLTANDSAGPANESAQTLTVSSVAPTADTHGTVVLNGGTVTYTAEPNYFGPASFTYQVCDNGTSGATPDPKCSVGTVNVTVTAANDPPVANAQSVTTNEDTAKAITLTANDLDHDLLTYSIVTGPQHGVLTGTAPAVTYTPSANYHGSDSFTFTVNDGSGDSNVATVGVTINAVNDAPVAVDDSASAVAGNPDIINVLQNDFDVDNGSVGSLVASVSLLPPTSPANLAFSTAAEAVASTGLVYVASGRYIGVFDPATNQPVAAIPLPVQQGSPTLSQVNQTTGFVYFRANSVIFAVDARPTLPASGNPNPAFNTVAATLRLGADVQALDIDEPSGRLYVSYAGQTNNPPQAGLAVIDVNPSSGTFHHVLNTFPSPVGIRGIAVNHPLNTLYAAAGDGVYVMDLGTMNGGKIAGTSTASSIVVDPNNNMVWVSVLASSTPNVASNQMYAIDAANGNAVTSITLPNFVSNFIAVKHLAVNTTTHRVYVRSNDPDLTHSGNVFIVDGDRSSGTFTQVMTTVPVGRDGGAVDLVVDETGNLAITTSPDDLRITVIDGNNAATSFTANQVVTDVTVNAATHRAYVVGALTVFNVLTLDGTPALSPPVQIGAETSGVTVDTTAHRAYLGRTAADADLIVLNKNGQDAPVGGLPHHAGRLTFLATKQSTPTTPARVYVLNSSANFAGTNAALPGFVSVIDPATNSVIANVPVGNSPSGLGINQSTNKIYVGSLGGGNNTTGAPAGITVINGADNTTVTADTSDPGFAGMGFSRDFVALANATTNKIYFRTTGPSGTSSVTAGVLNGVTNVATPLSTSLGQVTTIRVNNTLNRVYVANSAGQFFVLDGADNSILAPTPLMIGSPSQVVANQTNIAVDEINAHVYVADFNANTLSVVNANTNAVIATLPVGAGPTSVAFNRITHRVFVGSAFDNALTVVDGTALAIVGTVNLPYPPTFLAVDPAESRIYAATGGNTGQVGVMVIADANNPIDHTLSINSVTQPAQGAVAPNADGTVTYSPVAGASGTDTFTYTITDGQLSSNAATVTVSLSAPISVTPASLPNALIGQTYDQTLTATGGIPPYVFSVTSGNNSLPSGLTLSASGHIQGVPSGAGTFTFTVEITDSGRQFDVRTYTIIVGPPAITTSFLPAATRNQSYNQTLAAVGAVGTPTWSVLSGSLPTGLTLNADGTITGIASASTCSVSSFTVQITDSANPPRSSTRALSIGLVGPITITTTSLNPGVTLENYGSPVFASCGSGARTWTLTGDLPLGESFAASADNSSSSFGSFLGGQGQPRQNGNFPVTIQVSDSSGSDTKNFTLKVSAVDQQPQGGSGSAIALASGTRIGQSVSVGTTGLLTGVRFQSLAFVSPATSCPVTVSIEGVKATNSEPDDANVLATTSVTMTFSNQIVSLPAPLFFNADEQFAIVLSSNGTCQINNPATIDNYLGGAAFTNSGGGWASSSGVADIQVHTLVQNTSLIYLTTGRGQTRSVTLTGGRILIVPANGPIPTGATGTTADVFDSSTGVSSATPPMTALRNDFTATLLSDNRVLVVGGALFPSGQPTTYLNTAEIYNPVANTWTATAGSMAQGRSQHAATLLTCPASNSTCTWGGKVLITGGINVTPPSTFQSALRSAEMFDPATGMFSDAGSMLMSRNLHQTTLLMDGRVLITGGFSNGPFPFVSAEIFDPAAAPASAYTATGAMLTSRANHTATLLANATVLIAGGQVSNGPPGMATSGEIYTPAPNPANGTFSNAGQMLKPRVRHTATLLADLSVLLTGGLRDNSPTAAGAPWAAAERFVPGTGFVGAPSLNVTRYDQGASLLNGRVAISGGNVGSGGSRQAGQTIELYDPGTASTGTPAILQPNLVDGSKDTLYPSTALAGTGGTPPYTFALVSGGLPPGITLTSGTIAGTPTAYGSYYFGVRVTDSLTHSSDTTLRIRINGLDITTASPPTAFLNRPYNATLTATGIVSKTWSLYSGSLASGLTLNSGGTIIGTPTAFTGGTFTVKAVDSVGQTAYKQLSISVQNPLVITTTSLPPAITVQNYSASLNSSNGLNPTTFSLASDSGPLPPGVTLNGQFSGSPTRTGTYPIKVLATDSTTPTPQTDTKNLSIVVSAVDQANYGNGAVNTLGINSGQRIAQTVTVGVTGMLSAVSFQTLTCSTNPVTLTIEDVLPITGAPDDSHVFFTTPATITNTNQQIPVGPLFFAADQRLAIVLSAPSGSCQVTSSSNSDSYSGGEAFSSSSPWTSISGIADIQFQTLVRNADLIGMTRYHGQVRAVGISGGRVLIVGTDGTAEVFNPATLKSTATLPMNARRQDAAVALLSNGKVLVTGGIDYPPNNPGTPGTYLNSAEIYNPADNTWSAAEQMSVARAIHTATVLADGRVLVAGGNTTPTPPDNFAPPVQSTDIFSENGLSASPGPAMVQSRQGHQATLLTCPSGNPGCLWGGKVLVTGGFTNGPFPLKSAELCESSACTPTGAMVTPRANHTATLLLSSGTVLVAGGRTTQGPQTLATMAEKYDPAFGTFSPAGAMVEPRFWQTATPLGGDVVLFTGGLRKIEFNTNSAPWAAAEIYTGSGFTGAPSLNVTRYQHSAVPVAGGFIAVAGGWSPSPQSAESIELYDPNGPAIQNPQLGDGSTSDVYPTITLLGRSGTGPTYSFTLFSGAMPPGLTFTGGTIQGSPSTRGTYPFVVQITDSAARTTFQTLRIRINPLDITTTGLPQGFVNYPYSTTLASTRPSTWSLASGSGPLPDGLLLSSGGVISGTPTQAQFKNFTVQAVDADGQTTRAGLGLAVNTASPPFAGNDSSSTNEDTPLTINAPGVLGNDSDQAVGQGGLTALLVSSTTHGTLTLNANGSFSYTPNANFNGSDSFTYRANDGVQQSNTATVNLNVNSVNDAPSFTKGANQTVPDSAGAQTVTAWATNISAGPPDEGGQALDFFVSSDNNALFSAQPAVSPTGTLTYTPAIDANGMATVTVQLHDSGGIANGGVSTSAPQTFTITVNRTNQAPVAVNDSYSAVNFSNLASAGLRLNGLGNPALPAFVSTGDGTVLRLVETGCCERRASAFTTARVNVAGFSTTFQFRITNPGGGADDFGSVGADGFTFTLHADPNGSAALGVGGGGSGLGYDGIAPSVAVEFDTWYSGAATDPSSNHLGLDLNGSVVSIQTQPVTTDFDDGELWTAWIDYNGTTLEVRVSPNGGVRPAAPTMASVINLPGILGAGTAYVGFTAATGDVSETIDIVNWTYSTPHAGVLGNDTDPEHDPLSIVSFTTPLHGTVAVNANGTFTYTPNAGYTGPDSFSYTIGDGHGNTASATVNITVTAPPP